MIITNLDIVDWVFIGILGVLFFAQVYWYARFMAAPARKMRKDKKSPLTNDPSPITGGVSVVLCAHNESENLGHYLQVLLSQDYPEYEVIVVDDGSEDETRAVIERYMIHDPRLHFTFVPYGARVGSTKKLALTLAAKSARYDFLLLTDADCVPESHRWISEMMRGFQSPKTNDQSPIDIVLGFSPYFEEEGSINRLVRYDTLFNSLHYLGAALCGHPYMGVGRNLAYRKSLFFESGGFSHLMNNKAGDDDLFVNHVATKSNTAVVLGKDSYTCSRSKLRLKDWWQQKRRHLSVAPAYKAASKIRLAVEPLTRGLFYAAVIGTIIAYYPALIINCQFSITDCQFPISDCQFPIPLLVAIALFLLRWLIQSLIINISARKMGQSRFSIFTILWLDIVLPLVTAWMLAVPRKQVKW